MTIKYVDQEFDDEEYIDLDDSAQLEEQKHNRLIVVCSNHVQQENDTPVNEQVQDDQVDQQDILNKPTDQLNADPQPNCDSWPYPFIIYDDMVRSSILNKLNSGVQLKEGERSILFSGLHDACSKYGIKYPGPQKYLEMVSAILIRWKHLQNGMVYQMALIWWKSRLSTYFKNVRHNNKTDSLVFAMKSKYGKKKAIEEAVRPNNFPQKDNWGVAHFLPQRCCGLDDYSVAHFRDTLQEQRLCL